MPGPSLLSRPTTLALLLLVGSSAFAETAYISAQVEVGLHEERSAHSAILALLPEGTELEVLERDADAARVRLLDGREGWIPAEYVSAEASAPAELAELRQRLPELMAALERERTAREDAERRIAAAEEELVALRDGLPTREPGDETAQTEQDTQMLRDFELLADENRQLKQQIAELEEMQAGAPQSGADSASGAQLRVAESEASPPGFFARPFWHWLLIGFVVLFSFGLGGFIVDWLTRRRHGGFRI